MDSNHQAACLRINEI